MQFGVHVPASQRDRGTPGVMQTFTRGTLVGGTRWLFRFDNGFGASVINDGYGSEFGLFEVAVLDADDHLTFETPITSDVLGFLTELEVAEALDQIAALDPEAVQAELKRRSEVERAERIAALREELAALEAEVAR